MFLYEIRTGRIGESYQRAYAWADSPEQASKMFSAENPNKKIAEIEELFSRDSAPFITTLSDSGWDN